MYIAYTVLWIVVFVIEKIRVNKEIQEIKSKILKEFSQVYSEIDQNNTGIIEITEMMVERGKDIDALKESYSLVQDRRNK